jgi:hypothetical protein
VRYRSGFLNVSDENLAKRTNEPKLSAEQQLNDALTSPFSKNEITLSLNPIYGNHPRQGNYVRSLLHVDANNLKFTDMPDGRKKAEIAILAASFGDNGAIVDFVSRGYTLDVPLAAYERLKSVGFVYEFTFPVKKPGAFQYRVALRDQQAGTVGSASQFIEIPNFKKDRPFISGVVLQVYTTDEWRKLADGVESPQRLESDPKTDTARRRFKVGTVLQYGYEIYNARPGPMKRRDVTTRIRIFRDGKLVLNGEATPLDTSGLSDLERMPSGGAIRLNENMLPGEYVLQMIVIDNHAKTKNQLATQFVQFEVVSNHQ